LDVGGHIGVYTLLMAELTGVGGSVHAFEPYAPNVEVLRQNVDRNGLAQRVTLVQAAVDSEDGGSVDLFAGDGTSEASLYEADSRPARWEVPRVSLDAYLRRVGVRQVHFIKMDVEGAEEQALRGGESMLRESSPDILLEVHGYGGVGAVRFLEELGYAVALLSGDPTTSDALENRVQQVIAQKRVSEP
jgi:FkbM family methyltransferase